VSTALETAVIALAASNLALIGGCVWLARRVAPQLRISAPQQPRKQAETPPEVTG
jgi:hypothetical protein